MTLPWAIVLKDFVLQGKNTQLRGLWVFQMRCANPQQGDFVGCECCHRFCANAVLCRLNPLQCLVHLKSLGRTCACEARTGNLLSVAFILSGFAVLMLAQMQRNRVGKTVPWK